MKIFTPFFLPKKLRLLLLLLAITLLPILKVTAQIDNGLKNTFYQTLLKNKVYKLTADHPAGNFQGVNIEEYNYITKEFATVAHLRFATPDPEQNPSGAQASAFSKKTGFLYMPSAQSLPKGKLTFNVYDPNDSDNFNTKFGYKGRVRFPYDVGSANTPTIDNLFTTPEGHIGFITNRIIYMAGLDSVSPLINVNLASLNLLTKRSLAEDIIPLKGSEANIIRANSCNDLVYYNGNLYGMVGNADSKTTLLVIINIISGNVTTRVISHYASIATDGQPIGNPVAPKLSLGGDYGAVWIDNTGKFYAANNNSGQIFQVFNVEGSTAMISAFVSEVSKNNDGFGDPNFTPEIITNDPDCQNNGTAQILEHEENAKYIFDPPTPTNITVDANGYILNLKVGTSYKVQRDFGNFTSGFSEPFIIEAKAPTPLALNITSSAACLPSTVGSIESTTSEIGVSYQLRNNLGNLDTVKIGNALPLTWSDVPVGNGYYVKSTKVTTLLNGNEIPCYNDSNVVNIVPSPTPDKPVLDSIPKVPCVIGNNPEAAKVKFKIKNYDSSVSYRITPSLSATINGDEISAFKGNYTIIALKDGCESKTTDFEVKGDPDTPPTPEIAEIVHPSCTNNQGSFTIKNFNKNYIYTLIPSNNNIPNDTIFALSGKYTVMVASPNGCTNYEQIVINPQPRTPDIPENTSTFPSCTDTTRTIDIIVQNETDTYSFDDGLTFQNENIKTNLPLGTYVVRIKSSGGCISEPYFVTFTKLECPSITLVKTATFNDEDGDTFAKANETITYHFTITNTGNVPLTNITLTDVLPGITIHSEPGTLTLQPGESNSTFFSATYSVIQTDIIKRFVTNTATISGESTAGKVEGISTYTIPLDPGSTCDINVYNLVSANDDGKNDLFEIGGLDCYPENSLQIYNRWGVLVFERNPYNNSDKAFKGFSEGRVTISSKEKLPTGTYFYILKYKDIDANWHNKSGYLYLSL